MGVPRYNQFGGKHATTASLTKVLAHQGVVAPHSGQPFTEEMILGIGGGVGAGYFVFEFRGIDPMIAIGTRHLWHSDNVEFLRKICDRVGVTPTIKETASQKAAQVNLRLAIEKGNPALIWLDMASLPYSLLKEEFRKMWYHMAVGYDIDEDNDEANLSDLAATSCTVSLHDLAEARSAITSYKNRMMTIEVSKAEIDIKNAISEGIRDCCEYLLNPKIKNFGLASLTKWAKLVANPKDKKGWPKVFGQPRQLYQALMWVFHWIEVGGTGGSAFRTMYADFLDEAASIVDRSAFKEVAQLYRESAQHWSDLAHAVLPDSVENFKETKRLIAEREKLFKEGGQGSEPERLEINIRLSVMEAEAGNAFPINQNDIDQLLNDLKERILKLHDLEMKAARALKELVV